MGLNSLTDSLDELMNNIREGKGTVGQLFTNDSLYKNLDTLTASAGSVFNKLDDGNGTIGKFLTDDSVYDNIEEFTADIKANPWKLLNKPKGE